VIEHPSFAEPWSLLLLVVLLPLGGLWFIERRRRAAADAAYGGHRGLRIGRSAWRGRLQAVALVVGVALVVVATARPRWGSAALPVERRGIDIAVALDVSRSMTTADVLPSRAGAASAGLQGLLTHVRTDRVGLVIFGGAAFERSPLTLDMDALGQLVARAQLEAQLAGRGTDLGGAIDASLALLDVEDAAETQVIIVVSDGEDLGDAALEAAARAADAGVRVYTVAAGTDAGAAIPGDTGDIGPSRADRITLEAVAVLTGGEFRELDTIAGLAIDFQQLRQSAFDEEREIQPIERFQWFLAPAIVLLALPLILAEAGRARPLMRSRLSLAVFLVMVLVAGCGGSQLFQHVDAGNRAYEEERFEDALAEYREARLVAPDEPAVGYNLGNTLHRLRRFEEAAVLSEEALRTTSDPQLAQSLRYALGGHAMERGLLLQARDHYIEVLRLDPNDFDAKANLELVLSLIEPGSAPPPEDAPPLDEPTGDDALADPETDSTRVGDGGADNQPQLNDEPSDDGGEDGDGSGDGGNTASSDGQPGASGSAGDPTGDASGGNGGEGAEASLEAAVAEAEAELAQALAEAGDELTLEEALLLLELSDRLSALQALASDDGGSGGVTDR